ncbi:MAG: glycoside hydrolase family 65 protein [Chitinophagaceae bacterium]
MQRVVSFFSLLFIVSHALAQPADPWIITASPVGEQDYYGVTVANGMVGIVSSPHPFQAKEVVLAGAYDAYGRGRVSNFLKNFNPLNFYLDIDYDRISLYNATGMRQQLDMRHGSLTTSFDYYDKATISYTWYALRHLPYTVLMDVIITAKKDFSMVASSVLESPDALRDVQNYFHEIDRPHALVSLLTSTARSPTGKLMLCASNSFLFSEPHGSEPRVGHEVWDNNMHLMRFSKKMKAGEQYSFAVAGSLISSAHHDDPLNEAERLSIFANLEGRDRLIKFHKAAWDELWKSDIQIEGDAQSQQDVHSMLYHLYSFVREGTAFSPSPMGLSGLGYNGHVFWDTELWMYPALLVLHPEMAKGLVDYRFNRMEAARQNAFAHGYKGAMFPWESAASGVEETPVWALSGPFEHHITACVGIAAWNYYCVTQDKTWLKEKGWPILSATADFWASRVERNGPGHYDINNVVAADEWAENVDNNAFTNAAAKANLHYAAEAARLLGLPANADWQQVHDNIPILALADGVTKEHAAYKGEGIKQADVNLLAYPLKEITDPVRIRKDLEYYAPRVGNGPAMTQAIFALLYARLGDSAKAFHFFKDGYILNKKPPFGVLAETKGGGNPYFATGAGGMLQSVLMGFGGLEITPAGITQVKSVLPASWKKLTITRIGPGGKTFVVK